MLKVENIQGQGSSRLRIFKVEDLQGEGCSRLLLLPARGLEVVVEEGLGEVAHAGEGG